MCNLSHYEKIVKAYQDLDDAMMHLGTIIGASDLCSDIKLRLVGNHISLHIPITQTKELLQEALEASRAEHARKN